MDTGGAFDGQTHHDVLFLGVLLGGLDMNVPLQKPFLDLADPERQREQRNQKQQRIDRNDREWSAPCHLHGGAIAGSFRCWEMKNPRKRKPQAQAASELRKQMLSRQLFRQFVAGASLVLATMEAQVLEDQLDEL